jgi:peptidylprolyl isomerase
VSRRLRRLPILLLPLVLATTLAACGDDSSSDGGSDGGSSSSSDALHGITITGDIGAAPEVKWDGELKADKVETTVVAEGDGEELKEGDKVQANLWIGNGFTQEQAYSTYDKGGQAETVTASSGLSPVFKDAILGQKIGSRVAVIASAEDAFGPSGNPDLKIANKDSVLIIVDLMEKYTPPEPTEVPASKMPEIVEKKGEPTALDFTGLPEPKADDDLQRTVLKEGDGATVSPDSTVTADYLGMVYGAKKPFDESYSKDPAEFSLAQVVQGWTYGLSGLKVGSRVLLAIPPSLGYGAQAQGDIPANSTLYFVVDIRSAK